MNIIPINSSSWLVPVKTILMNQKMPLVRYKLIFREGKSTIMILAWTRTRKIRYNIYIYIHTCLSGTGKRYSNRKETSCLPLLNAGFEPNVSDTYSPADWMPADKPTELSKIKLKTWTRQPSLWSASIQPTRPHCQLAFAPGYIYIFIYIYICKCT